MQPFRYVRAFDSVEAARICATSSSARYLGGGTNLLDLMKYDVERPTTVVDVNRLELAAINIRPGSADLVIGAVARNTEVANHALVRQRFPLLTQAILAGASSQIRNMATMGGNLNQRTRCPYFYDTALPCNKRRPQSGCGALEGVNRNHAIFGWSERCVATHPSDMCIALTALDAVIRVQDSLGGERTIAFADYHRLPGDTPHRDNTLGPGELITAIELPANNLADRSCYVKVRERTSYAFAMVSVAAALEVREGVVIDVRLAMGGVAHKPWRAFEAERRIIGRMAEKAIFESAAAAEMSQAKPLRDNVFKVELGRRLLVRALETAMKGTGRHDEPETEEMEHGNRTAL